ncbi:hypothetical protein WJX84_009640 [Apatococcus fuscideae]|uniref:beta-fructofuranosidase n=1 Tax=Apatococcus fuscideae TaxID=2026836 RepID=A0AAW1TFW7_9CHLO
MRCLVRSGELLIRRTPLRVSVAPFLRYIHSSATSRRVYRSAAASLLRATMSSPEVEHLKTEQKADVQRADLGDSWKSDPDKPWYHIMPRQGWLNDPNGPIFYKGRCHVFFQHVQGGSAWDWKIIWAHVSSADLVHWRHEPMALQPTKGGLDGQGCWSGNTMLDENGVPTILYTAVRQRGHAECGALPPQIMDLGLEMIEAQCCAQARPDDDNLVEWTKRDEAAIAHPPSGRPLTGFRDPFIIQKGAQGKPWRLIIGSGTKADGGTILLYESAVPTHGWELKGELTRGRSRPIGDHDLGVMWECPFFVPLQPHTAGGAGAASSQGQQDQYVLCVSPYPHHLKDRPTNTCLYWTGAMDAEGHFSLEQASGPHLLDLGDVVYAPTVCRDLSGRQIMWTWLQELRKGGAFDYAGCIGIPRILTLRSDGRIHQAPVPEVLQLSSGSPCTIRDVQVSPGQPHRITGARAPSAHLQLSLKPGHGCRAAGIVLRPWLLAGSQDGSTPTAAVLLVDWANSRLEMVYPSDIDKTSLTFPVTADTRRTGGSIALDADGSIQLSIFADHSIVEVFTAAGDALATRVYRGSDQDQQARTGDVKEGLKCPRFDPDPQICRRLCGRHIWALAELLLASAHVAPSFLLVRRATGLQLTWLARFTWLERRRRRR